MGGAAGMKDLTDEAERQALEELGALERLAASTVSNAAEVRRALEELGEFERRLRS